MTARSKWHVLLAGALVLGACSTTTHVDRLRAEFPARPDDCEIAFFDRTTPPPAGYHAIGKIESHIKRNVFFGGRVSLKDDAFHELRAKACHLGGDAVVIDDHLESSASEMSHVHVWATVLRRTAAP